MANETIEIILRDETFPRPNASEFLLRLSTPRISAHELVEELVRAECDRQLVQRGESGSGNLEQRTEQEALVNGRASKASDFEDTVARIADAVAAFENNSFVILIGEKQITGLSEEIVLEDDTVVTFLRLNPLKGG